MKNIRHSKSGEVVWKIAIPILIFFVLVFIVTKWINSNFQSSQIQKPVVAEPQVIVDKIKILHKDLVRKMMFDPTREFAQSIIFDGEEEIARYKTIGEKIYDIQGIIPDGKVRFFDESADTYGFEHYESGKRHGTYEEHYNGGSLKKEIQYFWGDIRTIKEYFFDGSLRMEADYADGLMLTDNKETGKGRVYYRNGTLMYEWNLVNNDEKRYKRSYNIEGVLVETKHFDKNGVLLKTDTVALEPAVP